ncbi:MAG: GrpB family protein [Trueperaceae bacterium]|nr:GrpB family protein [Trueperaceae bacterium]
MSARIRPRLERVDATWAATGTSWCARVEHALGDALDGGHLYDVAHVGSTAVPGLLAQPTLDLLAQVHPWPLPSHADARIVDLGFVRHGQDNLIGRTFYTLGRHDVHLHVVGHESDGWHRRLALRDHLRASSDARARYEAATLDGLARSDAIADDDAARAAYNDAKASVLAALEVDALAHALERTGFHPILDLARALADAPTRWAIAGGWALDLIAGAPARHHDDIDIAVDAAAAPDLLDALAHHGIRASWVIAGNPARYLPRNPGEAHPGGGHQAHARRGDTWVDVVIEPWTATQWRYRRDPRIMLPLHRAIRHAIIDGVDVPVMAPEAVLLFKATTGGRTVPRPKDDADLARALPMLDADARAWLDAALPAGHPWRKRLTSR